MNLNAKPKMDDLISVAVYADNPELLYPGAPADLFVGHRDTAVQIAAIGDGNGVEVYAAGGALGQDMDAFAARLTAHKAAGKVLVVQQAVPTALLLRKKYQITFSRTFPALNWLVHRQQPATATYANKLARIDLQLQAAQNDWTGPMHARALACAQEAADGLAVAGLAVDDSGFSALEWANVEHNAQSSLAGIRLSGERASVLLAEARIELATTATRLTSIGLDPAAANDPAALRAFVDRRFGVQVESVSAKSAALQLAARHDPELRAFLDALGAYRRAVADTRDLESIGAGDRHAYGALRYGGAKTGRVAGGGIDGVLNLQALRKSRTDCPPRTRLTVVPPPKKSTRFATPAPEFVSLDLKQIEPRTHALLANESALLEMFAAGKDPYVWFGARLFPGTEIGGRERKIGKEALLGLGYGMGARTFLARLVIGGVDADKALATKIHAEYHETFQRMSGLGAVYWTAIAAAVNGERVEAGMCAFEPAASLDGDLPGGVKVGLPTGRALYYLGLRLDEEGGRQGVYVQLGKGRADDEVEEVTLYPGKLLENIVQAVARDVLMAMVLEIEAAGFSVPLTIHDEAIVVWRPTRMPQFLDEGRLAAQARLKALMSVVPDSLPALRGLPVEAVVNTSIRTSLGD